MHSCLSVLMSEEGKKKLTRQEIHDFDRKLKEGESGQKSLEIRAH